MKAPPRDWHTSYMHHPFQRVAPITLKPILGVVAPRHSHGHNCQAWSEPHPHNIRKLCKPIHPLLQTIIWSPWQFHLQYVAVQSSFRYCFKFFRKKQLEQSHLINKKYPSFFQAILEMNGIKVVLAHLPPFFFLQITPWECHFSFAFPNKPADVFRFLYHPAAVRLQRRPLQGWPGHGLENDGKSQLTRPKNDDIYHGDSSWGCPKMVGFPPKSSHFDRVFQYKPSILGYPYIFSTKWGFPNMVGFPYPNHGVFLLKIDDHFGLWNGGATIWGNPHMGWIDGMKFENGDESFFLVFQKTR